MALACRLVSGLEILYVIAAGGGADNIGRKVSDEKIHADPIKQISFVIRKSFFTDTDQLLVLRVHALDSSGNLILWGMILQSFFQLLQRRF